MMQLLPTLEGLLAQPGASKAAPEPAKAAEQIIAKIRAEGMPNYYGPQRFGRGGETADLEIGFAVHGDPGEPPGPARVAMMAPGGRMPRAICEAQRAL